MVDGEQTTQTNATGNEPNPNNEENQENLSPLEKASKTAQDLKTENDRREKIIEEEKALQANKLMGGSAGGNVETEPPKEETEKEYAQRISKGELKEGEGVPYAGE